MVILYTSDKNPITELVDSKLQDLGLLIYNESKKGNNVDELLEEFITLSKDPKNNLNNVDITRYGLEEVIINDKYMTGGQKRVVPFLNYVFNQNILINAIEEEDSTIITFINFLRSIFHIQGGLRVKTNRYYKAGSLFVILDFNEYKCNEVYKESNKVFSN